VKIGRYPRWGVAALAAALLGGCAGGPSAPEEVKRESYFEVVGVFAAPGKGLADMTYADGNIWLADEDGAGLIYRIDPASGSVLSSAGTSYGPPAAICSDGKYIYVAAVDTGDVYRHSLTPRLEELAHFPTGLADIRGMFYDAGTFHVFDQATQAIYAFDDGWQPQGWSRVDEEPQYIRGFEKAGGRVWSADWRGGWLNWHRKDNLDINRKFATARWHPAGLAWNGAYLFVGDTGSRGIYKLDISAAP